METEKEVGPWRYVHTHSSHVSHLSLTRLPKGPATAERATGGASPARTLFWGKADAGITDYLVLQELISVHRTQGANLQARWRQPTGMSLSHVYQSFSFVS